MLMKMLELACLLLEFHTCSPMLGRNGAAQELRWVISYTFSCCDELEQN